MLCGLLTQALASQSSIEPINFSEPYSAIDADALKQVSSMIPENWGVIALTQGDLNRDGYTDYAVVVQTMIPDAKPDEQEDPFDRLSQHIGPRHLIVVLSEKDVTKSNGHTLKHHRRYRRFIPEYDGISHNQDAFSYLVINNSLLEFRFQGEEPITRKRHYITYKFPLPERGTVSAGLQSSYS